MSSVRRATTVFWGAMLIATGGLLLAMNFGLSIPIWSALALYWPVFLILWGGVKLIDRIRTADAFPGRPLFGAGEIALIFGVVLVGSAITAFANFSPKLTEVFRSGALHDVLAMTGNRYVYAEHKEITVASGSVIDILNMYGDVEIRPGTGNSVVLDVQKTVYALDREEGGRMAADFEFSITRDPDSVVRIRSSRDRNPVEGPVFFVGRQRYRSSLTIQVPPQSSVRLTNRNGNINVVQLTGDQEVHNTFGSVTLNAITGRAQVSNRNGDIALENISSAVTVTNSFGSIHARNIRGAVSINGAHSDVDVDTVAGTATVETSFNDLRIRNARSTVDLKNRHGSIDVDLTEPPGGDIRVDADFGDVTLRLPGASNFSVDARARNGSFQSDFTGPENVISGMEHRAVGSVGTGGHRVTINSAHGSVRLIKT